MEGEWTNTRLEIVGYRETGTGILKGVDEINTVLDEQVGLNVSILSFLKLMSTNEVSPGASYPPVGNPLQQFIKRQKAVTREKILYE